MISNLTLLCETVLLRIFNIIFKSIHYFQKHKNFRNEFFNLIKNSNFRKHIKFIFFLKKRLTIPNY